MPITTLSSKIETLIVKAMLTDTFETDKDSKKGLGPPLETMEGTFELLKPQNEMNGAWNLLNFKLFQIITSEINDVFFFYILYSDSKTGPLL